MLHLAISWSSLLACYTTFGMSVSRVSVLLEVPWVRFHVTGSWQSSGPHSTTLMSYNSLYWWLKMSEESWCSRVLLNTLTKLGQLSLIWYNLLLMKANLGKPVWGNLDLEHLNLILIRRHLLTWGIRPVRTLVIYNFVLSDYCQMCPRAFNSLKVLRGLRPLTPARGAVPGPHCNCTGDYAPRPRLPKWLEASPPCKKSCVCPFHKTI